MNITKKMLNKELQSKFWIMKVLAFFMSKPWALSLINRFGERKNGTNISGLNCRERYIGSKSGDHEIRVRIFKPLNMKSKLPAMLYIHAGGYLIGTPELFSDVIKRFIDSGPCVVVSPDYRRATKDPYPAAFDDCYDTLLWMQENSELLGVIADKFIVAGHSSGGGLTAAVSLKASLTQEINVAFQIPVYPMIDDRQITDSIKNNNGPVWNSRTNKFAWNKYLKNLNENNTETPPFAAPARTEDYSKLPPTITFVGEIDPLRDETIEYVKKLEKSNIPVKFKVFKGCFHAFEILVPNAKISEEAWEFVLSAYNDYLKKYIYSKN